jgi:succinate-acetate transporter protein
MVKGNTFAATAFFSYGAFWMAWYVAQFVVKTAAVTGAVPAFTGAKTFPVGETLIMSLWGVFTFLFWIPTLRKNGCLCTVFGSLWVTFFLLAGGQWSAGCNQAAGYVGFLCGCSAIYTAFAEVRDVLFNIRRSLSAAALTATRRTRCFFSNTLSERLVSLHSSNPHLLVI